VTPPLCASCGQPASEALAGPEHGWECRNEACPEFGQSIDANEPGTRSEGTESPVGARLVDRRRREA
jgi:hypothetical protein